jgi:hypothetical protein
MGTMIESRWATGTYEMLLQRLKDDDEADVMITVFAIPLTLDPADDEDAPVLAQVEAKLWELGLHEEDTPDWPLPLREIGEHGLKPEQVEAEYGPGLGLRILLALYQAVQADMQGTDMEGRPWRQPSAAAGPFQERVLDLLLVLNTRLDEL